MSLILDEKLWYPDLDHSPICYLAFLRYPEAVRYLAFVSVLLTTGRPKKVDTRHHRDSLPCSVTVSKVLRLQSVDFFVVKKKVPVILNSVFGIRRLSAISIFASFDISFRSLLSWFGYQR